MRTTPYAVIKQDYEAKKPTREGLAHLLATFKHRSKKKLKAEYYSLRNRFKNRAVKKK